MSNQAQRYAKCLDKLNDSDKLQLSLMNMFSRWSVIQSTGDGKPLGLDFNIRKNLNLIDKAFFDEDELDRS